MKLTEKQILEIFSTIKPDGVDITPSPDITTIEGVRAKWRWPTECPSDVILEAKWNEIQAKVKYNTRENEYKIRGVTEKAMLVALWEKIVENRDEEANRLQAIRLQVKQECPKQE